MKTCTKCKETKDIEEFGIHQKRKDGRQDYCKSCFKSYYQKNRGEFMKRQNERYEQKKEEIRKQIRQHYQDNKEKILDKKKRYYQENKDKRIEYQREYRQRNRESKR